MAAFRALRRTTREAATAAPPYREQNRAILRGSTVAQVNHMFPKLLSVTGAVLLSAAVVSADQARQRWPDSSGRADSGSGGQNNGGGGQNNGGGSRNDGGGRSEGGRS